ncbi:uncharacterized protein LOC129895823 [Solanum dulcamara]|uniref:uncharacterized protein LOC129895823 n=1 Tax=Solanum dulcamara TaxID=45834 RepID=UPI0024864CA2|nr:uncharacterized protein LOC129895823 [Solanum dulcamara]
MLLLVSKLNGSHPPPSWSLYKLNPDDSFSKHKGELGIGGLIRDDSRTWILGFYKRSYSLYYTLTELEALYEGLNIAQTHKLTLKKLGNPVVRHSFRQANKVADVLSRFGAELTMTNNPLILLTPTDKAKEKLKADQD